MHWSESCPDRGRSGLTKCVCVCVWGGVWVCVCVCVCVRVRQLSSPRDLTCTERCVRVRLQCLRCSLECLPTWRKKLLPHPTCVCPLTASLSLIGVESVCHHSNNTKSADTRSPRSRFECFCERFKSSVLRFLAAVSEQVDLQLPPPTPENEHLHYKHIQSLFSGGGGVLS